MQYSVKKQKSRVREQKKEELRKLSPEYIERSDAVIAERLVALPEYRSAETVFAYYSIGREVTTHALIRAAIDSGRSVALPVSGSAGRMSFQLIFDLDELVPGKFGIPEPRTGAAVTAGRTDIIIVPALCCDRYNNRLGYGAGYYDRYLAEHPCLSVCLCRSRLLEARIPVEETDVPVNIVISER